MREQIINKIILIIQSFIIINSYVYADDIHINSILQQQQQQFQSNHTQQYINYNNYNYNIDSIQNKTKRQLQSTPSTNKNYVNPLQKGMYPITIQQGQSSSSFEEPDTIFDIPRQSTVKIIMDLRHLRNYTSDKLQFKYGTDWDIIIFTIDKGLDYNVEKNNDILSMPDKFTQETTKKIDSHLFSVFAYKDMYMRVYIRILNKKYSNQRAVFAQTTSIQIQTPMRTVAGKNKSFAFVLENNAAVNLPIALPIMKPDNSYPDSIITYTQLITHNNNDIYNSKNIVTTNTNTSTNTNTNNNNVNSQLTFNFSNQTQKYQINNDNYWRNLQQLTIPFIPYISNCKNYGDFIFLNDIIENAELCTLYSVNQTIPVEQLGFLQAPTSDTCNNIEFTCIMDDAFFTANQNPKIYEQKELAELFYLTSEPIDFQKDIFEDKTVFTSLSLIPVILQNTVQSTQLPKEITLTIEYFQVDQYKKRIIKSSLSFGQMIDKTNVNSTLPFTYKFRFNLHSMNHAELAISFALDLPIYIILSIIIGVFSILLVLFYYCFFRASNQLFRRVVGEPKPFLMSKDCCNRVLKDLKQFFQLYKPIASGILLGFIPNFIMLFSASFLMIGGFWTYPFINCTDLSTENICETSIFESFGASQVPQEQRRGRLGLALMVIGFYACIRISAAFIPLSQQQKIHETVKNYKNDRNIHDKQHQKQQQLQQQHQVQQSHQSNKFFEAILRLEDRVDFLTVESYDGNTWNDKMWLRGLFIFMTILILIIEIVVIYLSFSTFYGVNIWFFTFILKISQIFTEETLKIYIENELLLGSLSCFISMSVSVSGLGAIDFFDFLFNTFINLGISCFEKTNQVIVVDLVSDQIVDLVDILLKWITKVFHIDQNSSDEYNEEEEQIEGQEKKNQEEQDNPYQDDDNSLNTGQKDGGNSSIFLTDNYEDSLMSIDFQDQDWNIMSQENVQTKRQQKRNTTIFFDGLKNLKKSETINYKINNQVKKTPTLLDDNNTQNEDEDNIMLDQFEKIFNDLLNQKINKKTATLTSRSSIKGNNNNNKLNDYDQSEGEIASLQVKIFADFCYNTFNLLFTPCQVLALWMFYDPNQMFVKWGITRKGLVYYYLFNILNIPFQIVVDILFLKTVEQLHRINIRDYFQSVDQKFKQRYLTWKVDEEDDDEVIDILEPDLRSIHRWYFSPQYVFCLSIFVGGCIGIMEGVIMCQVNNYNFFGDSSSFFYIICLWLPICFGLDFICVQFFCNLIWGLSKDKKSNEDKEESSDSNQQQQQLQPQSPLASNDGKSDTKKIPTLKSPSTFYFFDKSKTNPQKQHIDDPIIHIISNDNLIPKNIDSSNQQQLQMLQSTLIQQQQTQQQNQQQLLQQPDLEYNQINSMNWLQTSRMVNSMIPDFLKNHTAPVKGKAKIDEPHNIILQKTFPFNEFYNKFNMQNSTNNNNNNNNNQDDSFYEEINQLKNDIDKNRYLKLYLQDQVEQLYHCDIGVHQFILSYTNQQEEYKNKLLELFSHNFKRFKIQQDAMDQYTKLKKFDFFKAILEKEKKCRYEDIKQHFIENEYNDQKFLKQFLTINKEWLRKNTKILFDDLLFGENRKQLSSLRGLILERFSKIYGELKITGQQEIELKNLVKKPQPLKSEVNNQYNGSWFHQILKYWKQRCKIQRLASQLVGGYFMRCEGQSRCYYCQSNWGLTIQTYQTNLEDLFLDFYQKQCIKLRFVFNVFELFENDRLVFDQSQSVLQIANFKQKQQQLIQKQQQQLIQKQQQQMQKQQHNKQYYSNGGQYNYNNNKDSSQSYFNNQDKSYNDNSNFINSNNHLNNSNNNNQTNSHSNHSLNLNSNHHLNNNNNNYQNTKNNNNMNNVYEYDYEDEEDNDNDNENYINNPNETEQDDIIYDQLFNQKNVKDIGNLLKQRMIVEWQEYFFKYGKTICICLKCNDEAQDQFIQQLESQRAIQLKQNQLMQDVINAMNNTIINNNNGLQSSPYQPRSSNMLLIDLQDGDNVIGNNGGSNSNQNIYNNLLLKKGSVNVNCVGQGQQGENNNNLGTAQIIEEEECYEEQSYNDEQSSQFNEHQNNDDVDDKLSKFEDSINLNSNNEVVLQRHSKDKKQQKILTNGEQIMQNQNNNNNNNYKRQSQYNNFNNSNANNQNNNNSNNNNNQNNQNLNTNQNLNKSYRSYHTQESKTHPEQTEMDEDQEDNINEEQFANIDDLNMIQQQMEEDNNKSFKVLSARKNSRSSLAYFDDFQDKQQQQQQSPSNSSPSNHLQISNRHQSSKESKGNQNKFKSDGGVGSEIIQQQQQIRNKNNSQNNKNQNKEIIHHNNHGHDDESESDSDNESQQEQSQDKIETYKSERNRLELTHRIQTEPTDRAAKQNGKEDEYTLGVQNL